MLFDSLVEICGGQDANRAIQARTWALVNSKDIGLLIGFGTSVLAGCEFVAAFPTCQRSKPPLIVKLDDYSRGVVNMRGD